MSTSVPEIELTPTPGVLSGAATAVGKAPRSTTVWHRFRQHHLAIAGVVILLLIVILAIFSPWIVPNDPYHTDLKAYRKPPTSEHWLGTDDAGRDVLSRVTHAGRVSLSVGLVAVGIYTTIGIILGGLAGYYGGWVDSLIMRLADMVLSFPSLIVIIVIVSLVGPSIYNVMVVIGGLGWPPIARLVRANFLSLREREFVIASHAIGVGNARIIFRHMLPNAFGPVIVAASFGMANAILLEAGLSFLGLGVQPPTPSWGNMLNKAQSFTVLENMPWLWLPPGAMIALAVLAINFIGDGLRDALDPRTK